MDWKAVDTSVLFAIAGTIVSGVVWLVKKFGAKASENLLNGAVNITEEYAEGTKGRLGAIKDLRIENKTLKDELSQEKKDSREQRDEQKKREQDSAERHKQEVHSLHQAVKVLRDDSFNLQRQLAQFEALHIRLEAENEVLNNKLADTQNKILRLEAEIETLVDEQRSLKREVLMHETLQDSLAASERKLEIRDDLLREMQNEIQRLESELDNYRQTLSH